jgi:hypothetical protein
MPKAKGKKAAMHSSNYQDNITMPLSCEYDYDAIADNEIDKVIGDLDADADPTSGVLTTIERVNITQLLHELI